MKIFLLTVYFLTFCISINTFAGNLRKGDVISGKATYVFDGDTIMLNDEHRVRLEGIDCPETMQLCRDSDDKEYKCGDVSTEYLSSLLKDREVSCKYKGKDVYQRFLGICSVRGLNINAEMVRTGNALSREYEGENLYKSEEDFAIKNKKGLWQGDFTTPHRWRMKFGRPDKYKF